jgi:FkbM family methyltransferase
MPDSAPSNFESNPGWYSRDEEDRIAWMIIEASRANTINTPGVAAPAIVDIGACDGVTHSVSRGLILRGWGAYLVEPYPASADELRRLYSSLPYSRRVTVHQVAAAPADTVGRGSLTTLHLGSDALAHTTRREYANTRGQTVCGEILVPMIGIGEAARCDRIPPSRRCLIRPRVLSIDTEGDSLDLLESLPSHLGPILVVIVEVYDRESRRDMARVERWADARHWKIITDTEDNAIIAHPEARIPGGI